MLPVVDNKVNGLLMSFLIPYVVCMILKLKLFGILLNPHEKVFTNSAWKMAWFDKLCSPKHEERDLDRDK